MKTLLTGLSVAALMSAGSVAIAQDTSVGVDAGAGVSVDTPAADADVGADANAGASTDAMSTAGEMAGSTYASVTSSISGSADVDLSGVTDETQVTIVLLSSLEGDAETEAAALDEALSADAEGQTTLHANIEANAAIAAKLEAGGHAADDVVAVTSNADGSVIVYVDDRA